MYLTSAIDRATPRRAHAHHNSSPTRNEIATSSVRAAAGGQRLALMLATGRAAACLVLLIVSCLDAATARPGPAPATTTPQHRPIDVEAPFGHTPADGRRFTLLDGEPRWARPPGEPLVLTYALSPAATAGAPPRKAVRAAVRSALARWARVVPVEFAETAAGGGDEAADITVGFYDGDHGDGYPFDGANGALAHAWGPNDGRVHVDAAEQWTAANSDDAVEAAFDLETVVAHEIGHVLGLNHSSLPEAVMYPYIKPGETKELADADVEGVQLLYGLRHQQDHPMQLGRSRRLAGTFRLVFLLLLIIASVMTCVWKPPSRRTLRSNVAGQHMRHLKQTCGT
ncbi:hypothetical protein ACP70R_041382 [Stipagrostis hirtigluma subsp. patula]